VDGKEKRERPEENYPVEQSRVNVYKKNTRGRPQQYLSQRLRRKRRRRRKGWPLGGNTKSGQSVVSTGTAKRKGDGSNLRLRYGRVSSSTNKKKRKLKAKDSPVGEIPAAAGKGKHETRKKTLTLMGERGEGGAAAT